MNQIIRYVFLFIHKTFLSLSARVAKIRFYLNRWRFESAGSGCRIDRGVRISPYLQIRLGHNVILRKSVMLGGRGLIEIGSNTILNEGVIIAANEKVSIGENCLFAPRAYILDVDHKFSDSEIPVSEQGYETSPVEIQSNGWVGANAVITRGVVLGKGCVVGANSVVTKSFQANSIIGGIPAKILRERTPV